jgi:hypothetical protein
LSFIGQTVVNVITSASAAYECMVDKWMYHLLRMEVLDLNEITTATEEKEGLNH